MRLYTEISRSVNHINATIDSKDSENKKTEDEVNVIITRVQNEFDNNSFDFSQYKSMTLTQGNKKRLVKKFEDIYSTENILCQSIKFILDREFKIKYPNRNKISKSLFNSIGVIKHMSDFTIIKFDFQDYFNSVSSVYVYDKLLKPKLSNRFEIDLIKKFAYETKYAYAGLQTSNAIAEIIAKEFDNALYEQFSQFGLLYFERYIDDGIIILNQHLSESNCSEIINHIIKNIFYSNDLSSIPKCITKMNLSKFKYVSKRNMVSEQLYTIDFLGYEFNFVKNDAINITYGITETKRKKYKRRIINIIKLYSEVSSKDYKKLELLRHRILAFTSRQVYISKKFKSNIWKVKGFISNYGELRYLLSSNLINKETKIYLEDIIVDSFKEIGVDIPYFLQNKSKEAYSLYYNMKKNKTLLFEQSIGYSESALVELCKKINISTMDASGNKRGYGTLVREYLIKTKVGY